jgi:phospholipid/cholesterol/gamma-HCH transport system substrate-binding protein
LRVAYNFAGGLDVGSPVRVMGIKVGKVRAIHFEPDFKMPKTGEEVKLLVTITVNKEAWPTLRADSHFFINLAGVIGEKFLEITPGSSASPGLESGQVVRGEDPPRIDQMISQSYALAGKILEFVNSNEGSVVETIDTLNKLVVNFDKMLKQLEKTSRDPEVHKIVKNMSIIMDDGACFTQKVRGPEGQKFIVLLTDLLKRLEPLDAKAIKKFLQQEGIRARLF